MLLLQLTLVFLLIAPALPAAATPPSHPQLTPLEASALDTTWFGGTVWNADSARWEAVPGGTWTFDSGVGTSLEGWRGVDLTSATLSLFRRLTNADFAGETSVCVGSTAGLGGSASLWAGVLSSEVCWPGGRGYGNDWNLARAKTFSYPGGGQDVTVSFDYRNETESGFDSTLVEVVLGSDPTAPGTLVASYSGTASGTANLVLSVAGGTLPASAGDFILRFRVVSDGAYSDEDGAYPTDCGAFAVDDISLSGAVSDVSDFELGENGWDLVYYGGNKDWLRALQSVDLPDYPGGCGLQDSVLAFFDDAGRIPAGALNLAVSPWIDLEAEGITDAQTWLFRYDVFQNFSRPERVGLELYVEYDTQGPCPQLADPFACFPGPDPCSYVEGCADPLLLELSLTTAMVAARRVRFALGVSNNCAAWGDCPGSNNDSDPYFDNVRFGVVQASTVGLPPGPPADEAFTLVLQRSVVRGGGVGMELLAPAGSAVHVDLFDVAGRRVRELFSGAAPAQTLRLDWDLGDDAGKRVPAGIYFVRAVGVETAVRRLVVLP